MMQAKIRNAQLQKVPFMLVVGDREAENGTVAVRLRTGENLGALPLEDVKAKISDKYLTKALDLW
jgi:threonyl-tRNA synthetase